MMDSAKQEISVAVKGNFMVLTTRWTLTFADTVAEREDTFAVFEEKLRNSQASGKEGIVESNLSRRQKTLQKCERDLTSQFDMSSFEGIFEGFGIGVILCDFVSFSVWNRVQHF